MPLYEYECPSCGQRIEILQKLGEDGSALKCGGCGTVGLRKLLSGCAVQVSGNSASPPLPGCGAGGGCAAAGSGFS